jgi:hypothetical protein
VLAKWIAREFGNVRFSVENRFINKRYKPAPGTLGIISKHPSERCNHEWMSGLENDARPILLPLFAAERCELSIEQQALLTRWFVKTIILYDLLTGQPCYFIPEERQALMKTLAVPEGTSVCLASYCGSRPLFLDAYPIKAATNEVNGQSYTLPAYTATLVIKNLAAQLFSIRQPERFQTVRVALPGPWRNSNLAHSKPDSMAAWPLSQRFLYRFVYGTMADRNSAFVLIFPASRPSLCQALLYSEEILANYIERLVCHFAERILSSKSIAAFCVCGRTCV